MDKWAGFSLKYRALMFHRHFPETMISPTTIGRIYKKAKVRFKSIKKKKPSETMDQ